MTGEAACGLPPEPVYFVVERSAGGREFPAIIVDRLPERLTRKGSTLLVYACRLDTLAGGADLVQQSPQQLYAVFLQLRDKGRLPQNMGAKP